MMFQHILSLLAFSLFTLGRCQVTVSGRGTVSAEPDTATISPGVTTTARTAAAALSANNDASRRLLQLLIDLGISQRDIQTTFFNVSPQLTPFSDGEPRRIVGYRVTNDFRVIIRDIDSLGRILDAVVRAGSNDVGSISFSIENTEKLLATARARAVADATTKAKTFASAAGVKVGKIIAITEPGSPSIGGATKSLEAFGTSVPVATGELEVSASVVLSFEIA